MELEGTFQGGVVIPDDGSRLEEGTRVRFEPITPVEELPTIGELLADFCGCITDAPADLAAQHDHYRLGTPKR